MRTHPVLVTAPWYHWRRQWDEPAPARGPAPRHTRPVFQKFEGTDFVNRFLKDPQRSLVFDPAEDRVAIAEASPYTGRLRALAERRQHLCDLRKLYRDSHKRSYLVVCEVHCDVPGLPDPSWDHVSEQGFVVRRRRTVDPVAFAARALELEEAMARHRAQVLRLQGAWRANLRPTPLFWLLGAVGVGNLSRVVLAPPFAFAPSRPDVVPPSIFRPRGVDYHLGEIARLRDERCALERLDNDDSVLEGWFPDPELEDVGRWAPVGEETPPNESGEHVFPLYKLVADPRRADHSARDARLLFGVVPTSSRDHTRTGVPRFDAVSHYEIRCFVREAPRTLRQGARSRICPGALRWSRATEPYRIAPYHDLVGTGNLPVTTEMPDLKALAAQASALPRGRGAPVRVESPPGSGLSFTPNGLALPSGELDGGGFCHEPIPLITLTAKFLLEIFKPIVAYIFGLLWMLPLKFCIPPGLPIDLSALEGLIQGLLGRIPSSLEPEAFTPEEIEALNDDPAFLEAVAAQFESVLQTPTTDLPGGGSRASEQIKAEYSAFEILQMLREIAAPVEPVFVPDTLRWEIPVSARPRVAEFQRAGEVA